MRYKPYPKYKESGVAWLREVPEGWDSASLKFKMMNLNFKRIPLSGIEREKKLGKYPYYGASGIIDYIDDYIFNETTILIGEDGANLLSKSTPLAFIAKENYWVNNHAHILKPKDKLFNFWTYVLNSIDLTPFITGSAQPKLTAEALSNLELVFPSLLEERENIANYLDQKTQKIDTLIEKQQTLIKLLKEKRQALISHAVTKGLDDTVEMKDSGVAWLGEVPEHWVVLNIKRLCFVKRGASPRPIENPIYFDDNGEYAWVRISDVTLSDMYLEKTVQKLSNLGKSLSVPLEPNDLFLSIAGSVGKPIIANIKCCIHDGFVYFKNYKENLQFLYWIFKSGQPYLGLGKFGTQLNLNKDTVGDIKIGLPSLEEQVQIVKYIEEKTKQIDTLISKSTQAIELLKERRSALISAVVTGKVDVRDV